MPEPASPLLTVCDLRLAVPGAAAPVLAGLSAQIGAGVALVCGDEGSGKTSLLRALAGRLPLAAGEVRLDGQPLAAGDVAWFDPLDPATDRQQAGRLLAELAPPGAALDALVQGLDLVPHLGKALFQLSTGSRRKVFLAAALARRARLTLLDQPFMALDRPSIAFLLDHMAQWAATPPGLLLLADYLPPEGVPLVATLDLDRQGRAVTPPSHG